MPDAIAAAGPVAAGVDRAHVTGLQGDVVDLVELDQVLVAGRRDEELGSRGRGAPCDNEKREHE
jgi:hypothetical protein